MVQFKNSKFLAATIILALLTGLTGSAAAQLDNTDKSLSVSDREGKNADRIDLVVRPTTIVDRISGFLQDNLLAVTLDQDEVNPGDTVTGNIGGSIGAVSPGQFSDGCNGDSVDIRVVWYNPDGENVASDWLSASECQSVAIDYSFDVWDDADLGEWQVSAKYRHADVSDLTGIKVKDFGSDTYDVVEEQEEPEPEPEPEEPEEEEPVDSDGDGVNDENDECPGTEPGVDVDSDGCAEDSDSDGVADYLDECPGTPSDVEVDSVGCGVDSDGDGVADYMDDCPGEMGDGSDGCPVEEEEEEEPEPKKPTDTDPGDDEPSTGLQGIDQAIINFLSDLFGGLI